MTDARYVPRNFCVPFHRFGVAEGVEWVQMPRSGEEIADRVANARLDASIIQHAICIQIRERVKALKSSVADVAEASGMKPERLRRVLRGEVPMRFDDLTILDLVLGGIDVPTEASLRESVRTRSNRDTADQTPQE